MFLEVRRSTHCVCLLSAEQEALSPQAVNEAQMSHVPYARVDGGLMSAMVCTRPDNALIVSLVRRYKGNPRKVHW